MAIWGDDKKTKEMTEEIISGISETIAESIRQTMQPVFTDLSGMIKSALSDSEEQSRKASAELAGSIAAMQKIAEGFTAGMQTMLEISRGQQAVLDSLREVQAAQAETQKSLTSECETVFAGVKNTQIKLASLYDDIGNGATALVAREEGIVKNQKKVLDKAAEDLLELQAKWTENFNKAHTQMMSDYDRMFMQMGTTVSSLSTYAEALAKASESMKTGFAEFNEGISKGMDGFTAEMQKSVSETFVLIDEQLAKSTETLSKTTEEVAEVAAKLPKALRGLTN